MAKEQLHKVFLSASIPIPERDPAYYTTADVIAIRDAVRALSAVVIPKAQLVWGGHPSITPLVRYVTKRMGSNKQEHITLYQSMFYDGKFPKDNNAFEKIVLTPRGKDRDESLEILREEMISKNKFVAGVFIGGMDGVEKEFGIFKRAHPDTLILPMASTGAAAKIICKQQGLNNPLLLSDYAYMSGFSELLKEYI